MKILKNTFNHALIGVRDFILHFFRSFKIKKKICDS
jgi:hypothetical protein